MGVQPGTHEGQPDTTWGDWRLGDLEAALGRAVVIIGPAAKVAWVALDLPDSPTDYPRVSVIVEDAETVEVLKSQVAEGEFFAHFTSLPFNAGFVAEVNELQLQVLSRGEAGR